MQVEEYAIGRLDAPFLFVFLHLRHREARSARANRAPVARTACAHLDPFA